jgi:hypothetical protein
MAYFQVKHFLIFSKDGAFNVDNNIQKTICSKEYQLVNDVDKHYDPIEFFDYLKNISNMNQDVKYKVLYKYIYHNHSYINEYMNQMEVLNGVITDKLIK